MSATAEKTDPALWEKVKKEVTAGSKGGEPGEWSARKAQMAVSQYKKAGGGYKGKKAADNHLAEWTDEDWDTKSGARSKDTGERYLPRKAREKLTDKEYEATSDKKRADTAKGVQHSAQPAAAREKTAAAHLEGMTLAELRDRAAKHGIAGRSRMKKAELVSALAHHPSHPTSHGAHA